MDTAELAELFGTSSPVIGMLHLRPLPGSPDAEDLPSVRQRLLQDAQALFDGGVDGFILENFGDAPYYPNRVHPQTVAYMTLIGQEVRDAFPKPLGINVLRNDALSALAIATAVGAQFIRVNVYMGARVADEGLIQGEAHRVVRYRRELGSDVRIFADVAVKHSTPLGAMDLKDEVRDTILRGKADAIVVSGSATGSETSIADLKVAKEVAAGVPVLAGSGVTVGNVAETLAHADGIIVGTGFKVDWVTTNPVDPARVRELLRIARTS
ncbi:MAG: BtpA/SgcQ family protein [Chloroflexi bacterium]|nr:BtpA/SgcQ family protein [Chloroflexota bacterium]